MCVQRIRQRFIAARRDATILCRRVALEGLRSG